MKINIQNLENGLIEIDEEIEPVFINKEIKPYYPNKIALHALVDKFGKDYRINVNINTTALYICDMCLTQFNYSFQAAQQMIFQIGSGKLEATEDIIQLPGNATEIDITPVLSEMVLLNHPIKMICKEDCKGICPSCGADLNTEECRCSKESTDPKWDQLRKLIK